MRAAAPGECVPLLWITLSLGPAHGNHPNTASPLPEAANHAHTRPFAAHLTGAQAWTDPLQDNVVIWTVPRWRRCLPQGRVLCVHVWVLSLRELSLS